MRKTVGLFMLVAAAIVSAWWWLGTPVPMPPSPLDPGERLYCVSYAPFRGSQTPLDLSTEIDPAQIDRDFTQLSRISDCVRTYSVDFGLDHVPEIAKRHGLKVLLGIWVSGHTDRTQYQITTGVALARKYPDVVRAVIVGNEALLRGEVSVQRLREYVGIVKSRVSMPVTYADVWEYWLRYRELADAVDFVTIHILPYWEDEPVAASEAASHVDAIRRRVAGEFPGKEIVIGEVGWPSAGRMREGALPSPANQALVVSEVLARGKHERFRVNLIEAFDQPWKRQLEGTVGGHWGLFDAETRRQKFEWGQPVSNHPYWPWQAAGGVLLAAVVFAAGLAARRRRPEPGEPALQTWLAVALNAAIAGILVGWTVENASIESLGAAGILRSLALLLVAVATPILAGAALAAPTPVPSFAQVIGAKADRVRNRAALALGLLLVLLTVLAVQSALTLTFDPRYRDFAFAPLTAAAIPFLLLRTLVPPRRFSRAAAEIVAAVVLVLCAAFIVWNETPANWQALWFAGALGLIAFSLVRARAAPD